MRQFDARLSPLLKGFTAVLLAGAVAGAAFSLSRGSVVAAILVTGVLLVVSLFSVRGYAVGQGRLIVKRPGWAAHIDLAGLLQATPAPGLVVRSLSLWSTRGLFGVIGYAYKKGIGTYRAYVTDPRTAVLLKFRSGKPVVVSPVSPKEFLSAVAAESRGTPDARPPPLGNG